MSKRSIERFYGIKIPPSVEREKIDIIEAGMELRYLTKSDVEEMIKDSCSLIRCTNILVDRRKGSPD